MMELTAKQLQAVARTKEPLRFFDPLKKKEYVLLPVELYDHLRQRAESESVDPSFFEFEDLENS